MRVRQVISAVVFYGLRLVAGIMLNIYVVLAASVIIVIASVFLKDDANLAYCIIGSLLFLSTTTMISILFLPKVCIFFLYMLSFST